MKTFSKTGKMKDFTSAYVWGQGHLDEARKAFEVRDLAKARYHARVARIAFSEAHEKAEKASFLYQRLASRSKVATMIKVAEGKRMTANLMAKGFFNI